MFKKFYKNCFKLKNNLAFSFFNFEKIENSSLKFVMYNKN